MIKQRNANITNQNKLTFDKLKQQSPFNRSNPYRVKAQFYSQRKRTITTTNTIDKNINNNNRKTSLQSNPQSLKYKRDYKQNPPTIMFQYRQLKDNFIQVKNNILTRNLSRGIDDQLEEQQYRLRLKQFVANKFCPSDPYLQIVKDKFNYLTTPNSQFQNTMKMSNLGISNLTTNNNKYTPQSSISYKDRLNPFYRKNLISSNNNAQLLYQSQYNGSTAYKWQYFPQIVVSSRVTSYYQYNSVAATGPSTSHYEHMNSNLYQISIPPPYDPKHNKQHRSSSYSQQSASRVSNGTFNHNGQQSQNVTQKQNPSPKSSLAASFGPDYQWKVNGMIKPYVDAVIEHHLQDPLNIQSKAPKQIKIKGKTFHLNYVNRFMN